MNRSEMEKQRMNNMPASPASRAPQLKIDANLRENIVNIHNVAESDADSPVSCGPRISGTFDNSTKNFGIKLQPAKQESESKSALSMREKGLKRNN